MSQNTVFGKVSEIVAEKLSIDSSEISPESSFESLGADSLDMLEIIMNLEKEFNIEIDDDKVADIETVGQAVEEIQKLA